MFFLNVSASTEGCDFFHMTEDAFHALSIADKKIYDMCHAQSDSRISDLCFNSRLAWNPGFGYQVAMIDGLFCMVSDGGVFTVPHLAMPQGDLENERFARVISEVLLLFERRGWELCVMYVEESQLPLFESLRGQGYMITASCDKDFSDYLYDGESMRTLTGKALHAKRNHRNRFVREYPDYQYARIRAEDGPECLELVRGWCIEKEFDPCDLTASDYVPIREVFQHFDQLDVHGGLIRIKGAVRAFALASELADGSAVIHFEKADPAYAGLYAAINHEVVCNEFPHAPTINREEDMGIEGLRKAKQSYQPVSYVDKYAVTIHRAG